MINVIPCNTGGVSKRQIPKSKSVEDMEILLAKEVDPGSPMKIPMNGPGIKEPSKELVGTHLEMISNRTRNIQRKNKKMKSKPS